MKVYQVECRAIITLAASDMQEAALRSALLIKANAFRLSMMPLAGIGTQARRL
jgi:hypothetical protein